MAESIFIFLQTVLWTAATVASLVDNHYSIAVDPNDAFRVVNPNVYFFGFASFCLAIVLTSSWVQQYWLHDEDSLTTTHWIFLAALGFLVMLSSLEMRKKGPEETSEDFLCDGTDWTHCSCLYFGIVLGALSGSISCAMVPWKSVPLKCQMEIAFLLLVAWACGIGFLTVKSGPAEQFNTLFLSTYASFFVCLSLLVSVGDPDQRDEEIVPATQQQDGATPSSVETASIAVEEGGGPKTYVGTTSLV